MRTQPRRFWLAVLLIVAAGLAALATNPIGSSAEQPPSKLPPSCHNHPITASHFRPFSESVWSRDHWRRKQPAPATLAAKAHKIHCAAGPGHVTAMKHQWAKDKVTFVRVRKNKLWAAKFRSFEYPDGSHWAVPYPIATCESGDPGLGIYGDYYASPSGAYGLTSGGGFRQYMAPKEQDEAAYYQFLESGEGAWAPYETGCSLR